MTHIDPDVLALIAMAELEPDADERRHLAECESCAIELAELTRTASFGRASGAVELQSPPPAVWQRISDELGFGSASTAPASPASAEATAPAPAPAPITVAAPVTTPDEPAVVTDRRSHRTRTPSRSTRVWIPLVAAAVVVGLVGGLGVGLWVGSSPAPAPSVVARAQLDAFPDWPGAGGSAVLEQGADGSREVVIDVDAAAAEAPLREVWLIKADASGLVSLGFLDGESGRFAVPAGIDVADYPLVDVSAEPDNGDPAHSGDSIVRGELRGELRAGA